jgi:hypothetical protein
MLRGASCEPPVVHFSPDSLFTEDFPKNAKSKRKFSPIQWELHIIPYSMKPIASLLNL